MSPCRALLVSQSLLFLACGSQGGDGTGGGGAAGAAPTGCVDVVLAPGKLTSPADWSQVPQVVRGGLWSSDSALRYVWSAARIDGQQGWYWLVVSSIGKDGQTIDDLFDLLRPGIKPATLIFDSLGGRTDGTFAIGYEYAENGEVAQHLALVRIDEKAPYQTLTLPVAGDPSQIATQTAAAWDGEAFAMHAYGAPPQFTLHVARVDDQGKVILPFTKYGVTGDVSYAGYKLGHVTATNPASGRTFVFDADAGNLLNGHLQDGTPLPGTPKVVQGEGISTYLATNGAISADADGAWLVWGQDLELVLQRVDLDGNVTGPAVTTGALPKGDPTGYADWAVVSRGASAVMVAGSWMSLYEMHYDGTTLSEPRPILTGGKKGDIDVREMEAIDWQGETWVSYSQGSSPYYLRVLKVKDGCSYPANPSSP